MGKKDHGDASSLKYDLQQLCRGYWVQIFDDHKAKDSISAARMIQDENRKYLSI